MAVLDEVFLEIMVAVIILKFSIVYQDFLVHRPWYGKELLYMCMYRTNSPFHLRVLTFVYLVCSNTFTPTVTLLIDLHKFRLS